MILAAVLIIMLQKNLSDVFKRPIFDIAVIGMPIRFHQYARRDPQLAARDLLCLKSSVCHLRVTCIDFDGEWDAIVRKIKVIRGV